MLGIITFLVCECGVRVSFCNMLHTYASLLRVFCALRRVALGFVARVRLHVSGLKDANAASQTLIGRAYVGQSWPVKPFDPITRFISPREISVSDTCFPLTIY